jgi:hypothetical protein
MFRNPWRVANYQNPANFKYQNEMGKEIIDGAIKSVMAKFYLIDETRNGLKFHRND